MSKHPTPRPSTGTRVKIGHDDPTLAGHAGLLLSGELVDQRRIPVVQIAPEVLQEDQRDLSISCVPERTVRRPAGWLPPYGPVPYSPAPYSPALYAGRPWP